MKAGRLNFSWIVERKIAGHKAPAGEADLDFLIGKGVKALIRLAEIDETVLSPGQISRFGLKDLHEPIPDLTAPKQSQIEKIVMFISKSLDDAKPVAVSCNAGLGRTGTILACYLVSRGLDADTAINRVRMKRPGSIETQEQEDAVRSYARKLKR